MVYYRRNRLPGGSYFFTVTLRDRRSRLLTDHIDLLRAAFRAERERRPFTIDAIVILPEHLHCIWTLPPGDADYSARWRGVKAGFSHALVRRGMGLQANRKGEYAVWQRRFWEHTLRDEVDWARHVDYIHYNPVRHGHVERVVD